MINSSPSNIWQFAPSSQEKLQRCLSAAKFDPQNKWIQKLRVTPPIITIPDDIEHGTDEVAEVAQKSKDIERTENVKESEEYVDFIREVIDVDPLAHFNVIVDMCLKDITVYNLLLNNLSMSSVEKLCNHIFSTTDCSSEFLENFYQLFLPEFLKKEHTYLSLDLLIKAKESHEAQLKILISILLSEKEFPSNILQEFVSTLDASELTSFMSNMAVNDIPNDMFIHNMYTIFLAYKECNKNENIQNFVLKKLTQTAHVCSNDKNYGRFLLTFIQSQKYCNTEDVEKIVELHRSAFRKPCINALNTLRK